MSKNYAIIIQFVLPLTTFYRSGAQKSNVYKREAFVTSWRFHNRAWQPQRHDRLPETSGTHIVGSRAAERLCCVMLPRFWLFWTTFTILNSSEIELKQGPSTWITHVSSDAWNLWIKIPKYVYGFLPWYLLCCKLDTLHQPRWPSLNRTPACDWLLCVLTGYLV